MDFSQVWWFYSHCITFTNLFVVRHWSNGSENSKWQETSPAPRKYDKTDRQTDILLTERKSIQTYLSLKYMFLDCPAANETYSEISTWFIWRQLWQANNRRTITIEWRNNCSYLPANFLDLENNLIIVYWTSTYSNNPDLFHPNIHNHQHEEPDTLIPMHVFDASKTDGDIRDIDIYIIQIHLLSW